MTDFLSTESLLRSGTPDDEIEGIARPEDLVSRLKDLTFNVYAWFKVIVLLVFIGQFVVMLAYGIPSTDHLRIDVDKTVLVRDTPACLAEKALHPNAGSDFRCKTVRRVEPPITVLGLLCVQAGWLMIILIWRSIDWGRVIAMIRGRPVGVDGETLELASKSWVVTLFFPHTEHFITMELFDNDEYLWCLRFWGFCDGTWFMLVSAALGQTNVYQLILCFLAGIAYSVSGYCYELGVRIRHETNEPSEMGLLRNHASAILHWAILIVFIFIWGFQMGDLDSHSHPRGYSLTLMLCYIIYLFATDLYALIFLWAGRTTELKKQRHIFRRSWKQAIDGIAFVVYFGGLLSYLLIIWSADDRFII